MSESRPGDDVTALGGQTGTTPAESVPRTSAGVTLALCLLALGTLAVYTGRYRLTGTGVGAGLCLTLAGAAGARRSRIFTAAGSFLFVGAAGLLAVAGVVVLVSSDTFDPLAAPGHLGPFAFVVAVGGATVGVTSLRGWDSAAQSARALATTATGVCLVVCAGFGVALFAVPVLRAVVGPLLGGVITPTASPQAVATFVLLLGATLLLVGALVLRLPVPVFVRGQRRMELEQRLESVHGRLSASGLFCLLGGGLGFLLIPGLWDGVPTGVADSLVQVTSARPPRVALSVVVVGAALSAGAIEGLRRVRPGSVDWLVAFAAHSLGGVVALGVLWLLGFGDIAGTTLETLGTGNGADLLEQYLDDFGATAVVTGVVAATCGALAVLVFAGAVLGYANLLPTHSPGGGLAAGGLVGAATLAGSLADPSALLFLVAGVAVVVWDVTTYGRRLGLELGHGNRRIELVHAGAAVVAGLGTAALTYGGFLVSGAVVPDTAVVALTALVSVLLLLWVVRE